MIVMDNDVRYVVENRGFIKDALPCRVLHRITKHVSRKVGRYEGTYRTSIGYIYTKTMTLY
jgi:hypothetical protein